MPLFIPVHILHLHEKNNSNQFSNFKPPVPPMVSESYNYAIQKRSKPWHSHPSLIAPLFPTQYLTTLFISGYPAITSFWWSLVCLGRSTFPSIHIKQIKRVSFSKFTPPIPLMINLAIQHASQTMQNLLDPPTSLTVPLFPIHWVVAAPMFSTLHSQVPFAKPKVSTFGSQ